MEVIVLKKLIRIFTVAAAVICTVMLSGGAVLSSLLPSEYYTNGLGSQSLAVYGVTLNTYKNENQEISGKLMFGNIFPIKSVSIRIRQNESVIPCGNPFGIRLFTQGVMAVKCDKIQSGGKYYNPSKEAGIEIGDVITHANDKKISCTEDLPRIVNSAKGNPVKLTIIRSNKTIFKMIMPVKDDSGIYKIGVWVRDSSAGIGTMTFYHPETHAFGGLGHGICDIDTGELMPLAQGEVTGAEIDSITKAQSGTAGTLNGHHCDNLCKGYVISNCDSGIFGYIQTAPVTHQVIPLAYKQQVKTGKAQIITTIDNTPPKYYDVEIQSINYNELNKTKNIIIQITDKNLLRKTNGIVQGMSGSPIIQDNRLVGAITHVFVNEPDKRYGIFAENMISAFNEESRKAENTAA